MQQLAPDCYLFLEKAAPFLIFWSAVFSLVSLFRFFQKFRFKRNVEADGAVRTELAGLPLTFIHSLCFVQALVGGDFISAGIFLWWGPGFLTTLGVLGFAHLRKKKVNWVPWRQAISWACKLNYLLICGASVYHGYLHMIFAYSVWIINDQIGRGFLALDADRFRRTLDDFWVFRALYPLGLLVPFYAGYHWIEKGYGLYLLVLWLLSLMLIVKKGQLRVRPSDPGLLRNMVYWNE